MLFARRVTHHRHHTPDGPDLRLSPSWRPAEAAQHHRVPVGALAQEPEARLAEGLVPVLVPVALVRVAIQDHGAQQGVVQGRAKASRPAAARLHLLGLLLTPDLAYEISKYFRASIGRRYASA